MIDYIKVRYRSTWLRGLTLLSLLALLWLNISIAPGQNPSPQVIRGWLQACLAAQRATDRISMKVVADKEITRALNSTGAHKTRDELAFRRDGDSLDIAGQHLLLDKSQNLSTTLRTVVTPDRFITTSYRFAPPKKVPAGSIISREGPKHLTRQLSDSWEHVTCFDGYALGSEGRRLVEYLLESGVDLRSTNQNIAGVPCKAVGGVTSGGEITLWLDPARGFLPLKAVCHKSRTDSINGVKLEDTPKLALLGPDKPKIGLVSRLATVDEISLARVGDTFVPTGGRFTVTQEYDNGMRMVTVAKVTRSEIQLAPSFQGTDAFHIDVPEGSSVTNLDEAESGIVYVLKDGKAIPQPAKFVSGSSRFFGSVSYLTVSIWFFLGLSSLCLAIWLFRRTRHLGT